MKKQPPKHKSSNSSNLLLYCIIWACFIDLLSCNNSTSSIAQNDTVKKPQEINKIRKDSFAVPKVIFITTNNQPKVIKAGKPIIRIDSSNGGAPFFTNYGTEQGLALSGIFCSLTDNVGNLWFATAGGGVSKYDGKSFTNYTILQGLAGNGVQGMAQDKEGNLWFGTQEGGVSKYDGSKFTNYTTAQGLAGNSILSIMEDKEGNIWFGSDGGGVSKYDGKTFTNYTTDQGLASNSIFIIIQDRDGNLWFGAQEGGASKFDGNAFTKYTTTQGLASNNVWVIMQDEAGNLWFGTQRGASKYDGTRFTNYTTAQGLAGNNVWDIMQDKRGNVWFATMGGGVSKYDGRSFTNYTTALGLATNSIRTVTQDRDGNIWFGTNGNGVIKYDDNGITSYSLDLTTSNNNNVQSIIKDNADNLWFGIVGGGLSKYDGTTLTSYTTAQGLQSNNLDFMMQDSKGNIWFSTTGGGVSKYDGKNFTNYTAVQGLAGNNVFCIMQDKKGDIWINTSGGGVSKYDGKSFTNYTTAQGLPSNTIFRSCQDKEGNIWFGTSAGASKFDGKSFTNYAMSQKPAGNSILSIIQDRKGNIWFGSNGEGAIKYNGSSFTNYTTSDGLSDNTIYDIMEDSIRNIIWFGTNLGLSALKEYPSSDVNNEENQFEIFNNSTGYPIKDVNWNSLCVDKKGILWAGCGDNKILRLDYEAINKHMEPMNLEIQNIKINNENICWNNLIRQPQVNKTPDSLTMLNEMVTTFGKALSPAILDSMRNKFNDIRFDSITKFNPVPVNLVLPYEDNNVSIDFVAIEPALPKQVKYQYRLEGYDKGWSLPGNGTTSVFGNIPEGDYTFKLKALSPYGVWSETEYKFKVLPPWHRTLWAYILYVLLFVGIIWAFIHYRSQKLRRENRILEEKVNLRTHQLKEEKEKVETTLNELKSTQSQLIQSEKMASLGELTAGIAHEIQNPLNFVNNFSEVNSELIDEAGQEIDKGNISEVKTILNDIKENEQKINHHGKRADAIVKGMLQHSRPSTGVKEPTDINALADEYLRLSHHGWKAKDKDFNAILKTDFDNNIGKINIIPQDIGKVLLNFYNNAFYAVNEKKKSANGSYEPTVTVSTKKTGNQVSVSVRDNGNGMPKNIVDKIFQPFFTTKPTGQGTGLGLSLSYDIVKALGGEIKVETKEGEGSEFVIRLPVNSVS